MAEAYVQFKQYEYHKNSNLVIRPEGTGPTPSEPTGEPESLVNRVFYKMGDKVIYEKPKELKEGIRSKREGHGEGDVTKKRTRLDILKGATVLDLDVTENSSYKPTTRATSAVYEQLLSILQSHLCDQPDVLKNAADEVLAALKTDNVKDSEKRHNCEEIIGKIEDPLFTKLYQLSKQITDYDKGIKDELDAEVRRGDLDDSTGVGVVFDEDDHLEEDIGLMEMPEDIDEEDDEDFGDEGKEHRHLAAKHLEDDEELAREKDKYYLDIGRIDPHWLQRKLLDIYGDSNVAVATEREILSILPTPDIQECENKLVFILKYDNFEFAKLVLGNRWKIFYCTRLGQAQTSEEKSAIYEEMQNSDEGMIVMEQLETVKLRINKEKQLTRNVRKEAATLAAKAQQSERGAQNEDTDEYTIGGEGGAVEEEMKKPSRFIDIDALQFAESGHMMSNSRVRLPDGSQRIEKKSYDEVIVQPYKKPKEILEEKKPISELPEWTHSAFSTVMETALNPIQTKVFPVAFDQYHENMLICAPTGAGKTNIAMLAILNIIGQYRRPSGAIDKDSFKIVYISPMKALVVEQVQSFSQRLKPYNMVVRELTGDISLTRAQIDETQVIVTTPEKWDIVTRKAGDRTYTQLVRLIIVDEIHLLHDSRGPVLESIIARTIRQIETTQEYVRLVGLSATLPNYEDVALFLRVKPDKGLFYFGNYYRPVPLLQTYIGIKDKKAIKRYNTMNQVTYEKVMENAGKNQVLVFVHSRKETVKTARAIRDMALHNDTLAKFLQEDSASREILQTESEAIKTAELKDLLPYGFAVHHAGLPRLDRKLVEDLFADRHIQVLVSTATLAWGVNLPAHTVIIKGTQVYMPEKGSWCELSPMDVMQMMGRGGRPQYDSSGHGIIITNHSELQYYLSLNNQQLPIESQMLSMLPDMLNAEIVLGTVRTRQDAVNWLGYSYLYVRMLRNPQLYGISTEEAENDKLLEQRRVDLIHSALIVLDKHNLIKYDRRTGHCQVTALGRVASHYYVKHPTISVFNEYLKPTVSDIELLRLFSLSNEFKYIPVREEEKIELQKLMERVPIPVKGSADESSSKVNVLLQAYISKLKLEGFALMADMVYVQQSAGRIMRALFEICLKRQWAGLSRKLLQFCKMVDRRMWSSMTPLRQFRALPEELLKKIEKRDFPWTRYYDLSSAEISELLRMPKMGVTLHRYIHQFPKLDLNAYVQPLARSCLMVELTITPDFQWDSKVHGTSEAFWILVEDVDGETILHCEMFILKAFVGEIEHTLHFTVPMSDILPPNLYIRVISDRWLHSETTLPVSLKTLILPERNPPHTDLLDLQPLPVTALRYPEAEALYSTRFKAFNPIQTQVFSTLYNGSENVLICAPPASGKLVCAEFAILRMMRHESIRRAVYIAPYEQTAKERFAEWSHRFGKLLGLQVNELSGDMQNDLKTLEQSHLVITTPEKWDFLSRRWKNRRVLQNINLFIVDELQLINSAVGPVLEVCVSRMRYISAQLQSPIRLLGLACSIANAKDIGEWIGAGTSGFFNFHPNVRTIPLEISIHGFDLYHRPSRLLAMSKPVYQAIKHYAADRPVIVFTSDRKQCRLTAIDLLLQAAADDTPKRFLHMGEEAMAQHLNEIREKTLKETLNYGVAYYHEGLRVHEKQLIRWLFESGLIQVLVTVESLTWGLSVSAYLVVIMDTKKYTDAGYVDYATHDILEMMGRATRPLVDKSGAVVLLCPTATKDYYKKFIFEPLPVESHLDQYLADYMNAEIVLKTIENKQDAVDWLTWTFYYRRLTKNPNYYGLQGITHQHLSDHLSELIETTIGILEQSQCASVEGEVDLHPLNLGLIAAFYYIRYTTIEIFNRSLRSITKRKAMLEIIAAATEFESVPLRVGEETTLEALGNALGLRIPSNDKINETHFKTLVLLYAHFNRTSLPADLAMDQVYVLETALRMVQGLVDVISSNGWLQPALVAMEVSQMIVQSLTSSQSSLYQLPHFTEALVLKAKEVSIEDVFDFINMEDDSRTTLLKGLSQSQLVDVAKACNRYPVIAVEYTIEGSDASIAPGTLVKCVVHLERDMPEESLGFVYAPYFPKEKDEQWWLVIGEPSTNTLCAIKRLAVTKQLSTMKLEFDAPEVAGKHSYVLYLMSDCYFGCDQEYKFDLQVK